MQPNYGVVHITVSITRFMIRLCNVIVAIFIPVYFVKRTDSHIKETFVLILVEFVFLIQHLKRIQIRNLKVSKFINYKSRIVDMCVYLLNYIVLFAPPFLLHVYSFLSLYLTVKNY